MRMRPILVTLSMFTYCLAIFFVLDFAYSSLFKGDERERSPRIASDTYHHGFVPNFDGYDSFGELRYRLFTDSLGFKDFAVREVPAIPATRRILLIGDSFTEGIGMTFDESFAGLLYRGGQARADKIEYLNAGVASYSPIIYYKKIKFLLERGLRFDEVVVFVDASDVHDEATSYFCIDDDTRYRQFCGPEPRSQGNACDPTRLPPGGVDFLEEHFAVTNTLRVLIKRYVQTLTGKRKAFVLSQYGRAGWAIAGGMGDECPPLGITGGIARAQQNMGLLADLLARHKIPLTVVVYPWPQQLAHDGPDNRHVRLWREFCVDRCKAFIDLFPAFFAEMKSKTDWYERYFIIGDVHYSAAGNRLIFDTLAKHLP
jgi:hypothetical protein